MNFIDETTDKKDEISFVPNEFYDGKNNGGDLICVKCQMLFWSMIFDDY